MFHDMGGGGMWFGWLFWIVIIALAVWAIARFTSGQRNKSGTGANSETALEILKKRYARGDISKEEFERMKNDVK